MLIIKLLETFLSLKQHRIDIRLLKCRLSIYGSHCVQDYDDFDVANEDDELEEFLGIPRKTPKVNLAFFEDFSNDEDDIENFIPGTL